MSIEVTSLTQQTTSATAIPAQTCWECITDPICNTIDRIRELFACILSYICCCCYGSSEESANSSSIPTTTATTVTTATSAATTASTPDPNTCILPDRIGGDPIRARVVSNNNETYTIAPPAPRSVAFPDTSRLANALSTWSLSALSSEFPSNREEWLGQLDRMFRLLNQTYSENGAPAYTVRINLNQNALPYEIILRPNNQDQRHARQFYQTIHNAQLSLLRQPNIEFFPNDSNGRHTKITVR